MQTIMGRRKIEISGQNITIHERNDVCDSVTGRPLTGSWLWDSALVLSQWMASQGRLHFDFQGKSVLELGAGAGLPGLTAAKLGASRVVLTDIERLVRGLLKNVEANGLGEQVEVRELTWGSDESMSRLEGIGEFDLVLMSDVFFDSEETMRLGKTLNIWRVCGKETTVWAASEVRSWTHEYLNELANQGFEVRELELASQHGGHGASDCLAEGYDKGLDLFALYHLIPFPPE